ncbi:large ribosomal subunit protein bL28m-like [Saccoglossus kowalevskii]|uniref:39S ribosomal protein L28, mitochondrial-like n=1 Tax=Saccoglossus kowalevskii TaxID=10224 RepID=A0ABM0GX78_SACKO|nr:PREDICTED: 39S ribosomal protein L28, mitochondrial-like [Saccoglossus kowalevskii]
MASKKVPEVVHRFGRFGHRYQTGLGTKIPQVWHDLKRWTKPYPNPIHWIPEEGKFKKDPRTGEKMRIQNVPIPVLYPKVSQSALWGGEGWIKGYKKRNNKKMKPRVRKIWKPQVFQRSFYSEILERDIGPIGVTLSTLDQIDKCCGFDFYILKTPREDLQSKLGLDLKRHMLLKLLSKDEMYPDDEVKREKIYNRYKQFIIPKEQAEWLGLSYKEAINKVRKIEREKNPISPLMEKYTEELVAKLKDQSFEGPDVELDKFDFPESRSEKMKKWIFGGKDEKS